MPCLVVLLALSDAHIKSNYYRVSCILLFLKSGAKTRAFMQNPILLSAFTVLQLVFPCGDTLA